eukprot:PLAT14721.1.p1 GENE.PLAT14721.1~~PLAT14721.1.p1  ORF type:complete len:319 (+),score=134.20 PLAT14721.1:33-959(+)
MDVPAAGVPVLREWKTWKAAATLPDRFVIFEGGPEKRPVAIVAACSEEKEEEGVEVRMRNLASGGYTTVRVKAGGRASAVKMAVEAQLSVTADSLVLFSGGKIIDDSLLLTKLITMPLVLAVNARMPEMVWDESRKSKDTEIIDGKEFKTLSTATQYCSKNYNVLSAKPFPRGVGGIVKVKMSGSQIGCYDAIGLAEETFNPDEDEMGKTAGYSSMAVLVYPYCGSDQQFSGTWHDGEHSDFPYEWAQGDVLTLIFRQKLGSLEILRNDESVGMAFTDIPSDRAYHLCARVCGHNGTAAWKIMEESSL